MIITEEGTDRANHSIDRNKQSVRYAHQTAHGRQSADQKSRRIHAYGPLFQTDFQPFDQHRHERDHFC